MSIVLTIIMIIAGIIVLFLLIAALSGKNMTIAQDIVINKPVDQVFDYLRYVRNHENFNVWMMMDPDMKKEFRGTDGQPGFVYAWDSSKNKSAGAGEQETKKIVPNQSIDMEIRFKRPMEDVAYARLATSAKGSGQTTVQWSFDSKMKFPMNAMMPMFKNMLGKQISAGLTNLKTVLEKQ